MTRSLTTLPNNSTTSQTTQVYTASGFNAGDLVYYQGGDYKSPSNLTSSNSVVFNNVQNLNASSAFGNAAVSSVFPTTVGTPTGSSGGKFAAVLTNGNIVQAFVNTGPTPGAGTANSVYFQIVNTSGVVQVAPTRIATNTVSYSFSVEVVALSGGGFSVVFINASSQISYAIYTNTGSLTTALTTDTGIATSTSYRIKAVALANGGFAIAAYNNSTGFISTRAYGATGTATYAWVSTGIAPYQYQSITKIGFAARSDSSTILVFATNSTTVSYYLYNSAGAAITNGTITINNTVPAFSPADVTCLADGTTYVIGYFNYYSGTTSYAPAFRFLPTGNTLGSENTIPTANINTGGSTTNTFCEVSLLAQASGGFVLAFADYFDTLNYVFYNASGTALSGTNTSGVLPISVPIAKISIFFSVTMLEITGYVNLYWQSSGSYTQSYSNPSQNFAQINSANYGLVPQAPTISGVLGTSTVAAGTAVVASSTPTSTKFYPATTSTSNYTQALGAFVVSPTVILSIACNATASCTLPNGQFLIAYKTQGSPYQVYVNAYSATGTLLTTINVGAGYSAVGDVRIAALSSGKFVVGWAHPSTSSFNLALYSSTFTQIGATKNTLTPSTWSLSFNFSLAGLANTDRYVVGYAGASGYANFTIYDNTNTAIVGPTVVNSGNAGYSVQVAADTTGGFGLVAYNGSNQCFSMFIQTGSTTYSLTATNASTSVFPNPAASQGYPQGFVYANGGYYYLGTNSSSYSQVVHIPINAVSNTYLLAGTPYNQAPTNSTNNTIAIGLNGNGSLICISQQNSNQIYFYQLFGGVSYNTSPVSPVTSYPTNYSSSLSGFTNTSATAFGISITPSLGNTCVATWLDSNNYPSFAILNSLALTTPITTTAGVSQSNTTSIYPTASTSTSVAPNTVLAGVAATTAAAGGTGQLVINGLAQLNSSYPSGTVQAFDYTGQAVDGVKGIINGRTLNMQGNS